MSEIGIMEKVTVRASSVAELVDCPLRWATKYLDGRTMPQTPPAVIGTAVHASSASFDRGEGNAHQTAEIAADLVLHPEGETRWLDISKYKAVENAINAHLSYCRDVAPRFEFTHIEEKLDPLSVSIDDKVIIEFTGTLDRTRKYMDDVSIVCDVKSGQRVLSQNMSKHKAQLGVYIMLASKKLGKIYIKTADILQIQTNGKAGVHVSSDPYKVLVGEPGHNGIIHYMANMFYNGDYIGNPSSMMCSEKYCPRYNDCFFR